MGLFFFVMAFIFLFMLRKNLRWYFIIAAGFIYCAVIAAGMYAYTKKATGQDLIQYTAAEMKKSFDMSLEELAKKGATADDLAMVRGSYEAFVSRPMAAWVLISAAFLIFLVYFVIRLYALNKYGISDGMPPFEVWRLPEPVMWACIACMGTLVFKDMLKAEAVQYAAYNGLFVFSAVYFTAGLAVVSYLFIKYKVPPFAKFMFYLLLVIWSFLGIIVILAGMLDTWFNFRKLENGGSVWK